MGGGLLLFLFRKSPFSSRLESKMQRTYAVPFLVKKLNARTYTRAVSFRVATSCILLRCCI